MYCGQNYGAQLGKTPLILLYCKGFSVFSTNEHLLSCTDRSSPCNNLVMSPPPTGAPTTPIPTSPSPTILQSSPTSPNIILSTTEDEEESSGIIHLSQQGNDEFFLFLLIAPLSLSRVALQAPKNKLRASSKRL